MSQPYRPSSNVATDVWTRFVGLFGGEAVRRKFGETPPDEWVALLGRLNDYELERGMRRVAYSGKANMPSLPEFIRLCRLNGHADDVSDGPMMSAPQINGPESGIQGWDRMAGIHFLRYLDRHVNSNKSGRYGTSRYNGAGNPLTISDEMRARVGMLIEAKNYWALEMREGGDAEHDPQYQRKFWHELMAVAESRIDALIAGESA